MDQKVTSLFVMLTGKTSCGLQYGVKRSGSAVGYCSLSIKCGTRDEEGFHSGIAHFAEHTIFKGTTHKSASQISSCLDKLGGELNAYTTKEEIVLHATVLKEDLPKAISLLLELATCPTFPEKEIEKEKGVVIEEINSYKDSPADDVFDNFESELFKGHPLGSLILGTVASVKKITSDELKSFVKKNFTPDRMALSIVAGLDEKTLEKKGLELVGKFFCDAPDAITAAGRCTEAQKIFTPEVFDRTVDKRHHEVNAVIGAAAPSLYEERERVATVLLANILAGPGSNSILNRILRERNGWVYGVESTYTQYRDSGIFAISLGCDKSNLQACLDVIRREIIKLQEAPLSESKLKAAKKQLIGQLAISSDNGEAQCLAMGKSLLAFGRVSSDEEDRKKVERVTAEEIREMAQRIFEEGKVSQLIYL